MYVGRMISSWPGVPLLGDVLAADLEPAVGVHVDGRGAVVQAEGGDQRRLLVEAGLRRVGVDRDRRDQRVPAAALTQGVGQGA